MSSPQPQEPAPMDVDAPAVPPTTPRKRAHEDDVEEEVLDDLETFGEPVGMRLHLRREPSAVPARPPADSHSDAYAEASAPVQQTPPPSPSDSSRAGAQVPQTISLTGKSASSILGTLPSHGGAFSGFRRKMSAPHSPPSYVPSASQEAGAGEAPSPIHNDPRSQSLDALVPRRLSLKIDERRLDRRGSGAGAGAHSGAGDA
eukprot:tig00021035_g17241.t1